MSDLSLYRKYRPQTFSHLVGQDHVRVTLLNALQEDRAVHAYLFCGPRGTGKTSAARLLAKALNCVNPTEEHEPCETCDICRDITEARLIDLIEIDAASNRRIDEIRDLRDKIYFAPTRAKNKVYIIDEVHMLTKEAFNALLKILEEPPPQVYFILATTEAHKIPETIISRCQRFDFKRIDPKTIMTRLNYIAQLEGIEVEDRAIEAIARNVDGGLRDAIGLMEQLTTNGKLSYQRVQEMLGLSGYENIEAFFQFLQQQDLQGAVGFLQDLYRNGYDLVQFTKELIDFLREELLKAVAQKNDSDISFFMQTIEIFQQTLPQFKSTIIPQLPLEMAVIRLFTPAADLPSEQSEALVQKITLKSPEKSIPSSSSGLREIPHEVPAFSTSPIDPQRVETYWPRVIELLKTPSLKQSLKNVKQFRINRHVFQMEFVSKFYMEKVLESGHRAELEAALEKVFGQSMKVSGILQKVQLESPITTSVESVELVDDAAHTAAEIFGGEVVEE